jgi:pSer/pThr/pTyr-binding forkhead associated (FHA) protein
MARQGTLVLVDLGSSNGTLVNGAVVAEIAIGVGDEIRIGDTRMLIEPLTA